MYTKIDLTGKKFNNLTGLCEIKERKFGCVCWKFKCECGNESIHVAYKVRNGSIKSCGCSRRTNKCDKHRFKKNLFSDYKYSANSRGLNFDLTFDEFDTLTSSNCFYCGEPPKFRGKKWKYYGFANGLDRLNSNLGYIKSNVVSCCRFCNIAKNSLSCSEFLDLVSKIYENTIMSGKIV